jgi:hypothetical protein
MVRAAAYSAHPSGPRDRRCISRRGSRPRHQASNHRPARRRIRYAHKLAGCDDPPTSSEVVKATVQGIRRTMGSAPVRKTGIFDGLSH